MSDRFFLQIPEGYFEMSDEQKAAATKAMWSAAMVQMGRDRKRTSRTSATE